MKIFFNFTYQYSIIYMSLTHFKKCNYPEIDGVNISCGFLTEQIHHIKQTEKYYLSCQWGTTILYTEINHNAGRLQFWSNMLRMTTSISYCHLWLPPMLWHCINLTGPPIMDTSKQRSSVCKVSLDVNENTCMEIAAL